MDDLISRQTAIEEIKRCESADSYDFNNGLIRAMNAIADIPSAQPEITWEQVKEYCQKKCLSVITTDLYHEMQKRWSAQPTIEPQPKRGKWGEAFLDHVRMGGRPKVIYCSECCQCVVYPTNFCSYCGADMREEDNDEI